MWVILVYRNSSLDQLVGPYDSYDKAYRARLKQETLDNFKFGYVIGEIKKEFQNDGM